MPALTSKPLDETTWPDFSRLVERHNGVWGGCWCMAFHAEGVGRGKTVAQNRSEKEQRVREGRAHAAVVYDGVEVVPVRPDRRAAPHQAQAGLSRWSRVAARLADHLLLRRPRLSRQGGRRRGLEGRAGRDRAARRRLGGELPRRRRGSLSVRILPLQCHAAAIRARGLPADTPAGEEPLGGDQGCSQEHWPKPRHQNTQHRRDYLEVSPLQRAI
jgi:hypothetical protein